MIKKVVTRRNYSFYHPSAWSIHSLFSHRSNNNCYLHCCLGHLMTVYIETSQNRKLQKALNRTMKQRTQSKSYDITLSFSSSLFSMYHSVSQKLYSQSSNHCFAPPGYRYVRLSLATILYCHRECL